MQPTPPFPPQPQARPGLQSDDAAGATEHRRRRMSVPASSAARWRSSPAAIRESGGRRACSSPARAPRWRSATCPAEQSDADETAALVAGEGQRCLLLPGDLLDRAYCDRGGPRYRAPLRTARRPGQQCRLPGVSRVDWRDRRSSVGPHVPHQRLRLLLSGARRAGLPRTWRGDRQRGIGHGPGGQRAPARLRRRPRARSTPSRNRWRRISPRRGFA